MKQLNDFFPILAFVAVYYLQKDMILATEVLIGASTLQIILDKLLWKEVNKTHLITFAVLVVLGGSTIFFQDERFIKWKPSIVYWVFSIALIGSQFIGEKNLIERMLGALLNNLNDKQNAEGDDLETNAPASATNVADAVPKSLWTRLNFAWSIFFLVLGFVNIYVAYQFDTDTWVNFKLFGITIANIVFLMAQLPFLLKYLPKQES